MTHPTSEMMILLSFLVLCVANNLVSTSEVNAPAPRSTNLTAVPTNLTADKLPLKKNQTLRGRVYRSVLTTTLNIQSPHNNYTVKKMIPQENRGQQFPGDRREPFRDNSDPFRNQPYPGDRRDPFRDNRDPFRNRPQFPGDQRDPFRDNRDPFRNQPYPGDRRDPFRETCEPFRNQPQFPGDRRDPFRDNRDPFRNQPQNQPRDNRNFRVPRENLDPSRLYPQLPDYVHNNGIDLAPLKVNRRPIRFDSMYGFQIAGKNNDGGLYGLPIKLGIQGSVLNVDQNPTDQASGNQAEGFLKGSGGVEKPAEASS